MINYSQDASIGENAMVSADTTELQQINNLLQTYAAMQNIVNSTLSQFGSTATNTTTSNLLGATGTNVTLSAAVTAGTITAAQATVIQMFTTGLGTSASPLELLYGLTRPTASMMNSTTGVLTGMTQQQWNNLGTQLSNEVTSLQEQSQELTNQISQETQQQSQFFTMGTTVLQQLNNIIQQIGANA